jgi:hypothetical protein
MPVPLVFTTVISYLVAVPGLFIFKEKISDSNIVEVKGSGQDATRIIDLSTNRFDGINLQTVGNLVVTHSAQKQSLEITADDNLLDYLTAQVNNNKLELGTQNGFSISTRNDVSYHLYVSDFALNRIVLSGQGSIEIERLRTQDLSCLISGSGNIRINDGNATKQTIEISGSGEYDAFRFQAEHSNVKISGSGKAFIHTNQSLDVEISGSGTCTYSGHPNEIIKEISGSGSIKPA